VQKGKKFRMSKMGTVAKRRRLELEDQIIQLPSFSRECSQGFPLLPEIWTDVIFPYLDFGSLWALHHVSAFFFFYISKLIKQQKEKGFDWFPHRLHPKKDWELPIPAYWPIKMGYDVSLKSIWTAKEANIDTVGVYWYKDDLIPSHLDLYHNRNVDIVINNEHGILFDCNCERMKLQGAKRAIFTFQGVDDEDEFEPCGERHEYTVDSKVHCIFYNEDGFPIFWEFRDNTETTLHTWENGKFDSLLGFERLDTEESVPWIFNIICDVKHPRPIYLYTGCEFYKHGIHFIFKIHIGKYGKEGIPKINLVKNSAMPAQNLLWNGKDAVEVDSKDWNILVSPEMLKKRDVSILSVEYVIPTRGIGYLSSEIEDENGHIVPWENTTQKEDAILLGIDIL
jgi:hypothetical protein